MTKNLGQYRAINEIGRARQAKIFTMGYQNLSIFASIISSPVARKVIRATKQNKDLSTPELPEYQKPITSVGGRMKNVLATVAKTSEKF